LWHFFKEVSPARLGKSSVTAMELRLASRDDEHLARFQMNYAIAKIDP
jgi:hypothetical protein